MTYVGQPSLDVEHLYNTHNKCYSNKPGLNWINLSKVSPSYSRTHLLVSLSVPRYLRKIWTLLIGHLTSVIAAMWFISNFCISCINIFSSYDTVLTLLFKIISRATCNFFFRNIQNYLLENLQGESLHLVYIYSNSGNILSEKLFYWLLIKGDDSFHILLNYLSC